MHRIGQYFAALWDDWVGRMSGGASVLLAILPLIWPRWFGEVHHLRVAMWIAAAACFLLVNFHAWLRGQKALEAEVAKHEGSRVEGVIKLGYVDGRTYIPRTDNYWQDFTIGCLVTLYVDATNKNQIEAHLRSPNTSLELIFMGTRYIGEWKHIIAGLTFDDDRVTVKGQACDFHDGYFSRGMVQGVPKLGYLQFFIPNFPTDVLFGKDFLTASVTITLTDTLGKLHVIRGGVPIPLLVGKIARLVDVLEKAKSIQVSTLLDVAESIRRQDN